MFVAEKSEENGNLNLGVTGVKRFFQWILGCVYTKKSFKNRITEMFHFTDAPHIIIYEKSDEHPWYFIVAIITSVLIVVLSLYYTVEAAFRSIKKFMKSVIHEPLSTVSTPRCLSPSAFNSKKSSPKTPKSEEAIRQKVSMNEPVNCVFVRPAIPKFSQETADVQNSNSEEDVQIDAKQVQVAEQVKSKREKRNGKKYKQKIQPTMKLNEVQFDASSNYNVVPTMAPSPNISANNTNRSSTGSEEKNCNLKTCVSSASYSECDQINDWVMQQIARCKNLENERSNAGACGVKAVSENSIQIEDYGVSKVSGIIVEKIQELIEAHLGESLEKNSLENVLETPIATESFISSLAESENFLAETRTSELSESERKPLNAKLTAGSEDDADIVIDDCVIFAESDGECDGSILVKGGQQKVLFRWTDEQPNTVDSVTLTGSFFGWNMIIPMKRSGVKTFEVCVELSEGMHDYLINVLRFD